MAMKSKQGWGWLVAGVIALGLNGIYHDGGASWARRAIAPVIDRIEEQAGPVLAMAAGQADWFMAKTQAVRASEETASGRVATAVAHTSLQKSEVARARAKARIDVMSAREEAAMARIEANRARIEARMDRVRFEPAVFNPVVCPRVRVSVPRVQISTPMVHVDLGSM
jgi:hypothetical protein